MLLHFIAIYSYQILVAVSPPIKYKIQEIDHLCYVKLVKKSEFKSQSISVFVQRSLCPEATTWPPGHCSLLVTTDR